MRMDLAADFNLDDFDGGGISLAGVIARTLSFAARLTKIWGLTGLVVTEASGWNA